MDEILFSLRYDHQFYVRALRNPLQPNVCDFRLEAWLLDKKLIVYKSEALFNEADILIDVERYLTSALEDFQKALTTLKSCPDSTAWAKRMYRNKESHILPLTNNLMLRYYQKQLHIPDVSCKEYYGDSGRTTKVCAACKQVNCHFRDNCSCDLQTKSGLILATPYFVSPPNNHFNAAFLPELYRFAIRDLENIMKAYTAHRNGARAMMRHR